jgi:hypothetical protein
MVTVFCWRKFCMSGMICSKMSEKFPHHRTITVSFNINDQREQCTSPCSNSQQLEGNYGSFCKWPSTETGGTHMAWHSAKNIFILRAYQRFCNNDIERWSWMDACKQWLWHISIPHPGIHLEIMMKTTKKNLRIGGNQDEIQIGYLLNMKSSVLLLHQPVLRKK